MTREEFARNALDIAEERPRYELGGDGSDGTCDCVGLCIGALRRGGVKYKNLHGTNWAARNEAVELWKIDRVSDLRVGDTVLKAYEPGDANWNLPARYANDPDQRDYYHAGVVVSVNPLRIVHMTSPTAKTDTTLGKWRFAFLWRQLSSGNSTTQESEFMDTVKYGSRGEDVIALQNALNAAGYTVDVDGIFGKKTKSAVERYQKEHGLSVDGIVGENTWKMLQSDSATEAPESEEALHLCLVFTDSAGNTWIPVGDFSATLKVVND